MSILEKIKHLFHSLSALFVSAESDEYADEAEEKVENDAYEKVRRDGALPARALRPLDLVMMYPKQYSDARYIVNTLEKGKMVIVILKENISHEDAARLVDFVSGAIYLGKGQVELLREEVFLCVPSFVELTTDLLPRLSGIPEWRVPGE
jgi:hypothetical protein